MVLESNDDPERDDEPDEEPDDEPDDEPNRNPTTSRMTHPTATPARSTSGRTTDGRPITSQPQLERTPWAQQIRFLWYKVDAHGGISAERPRRGRRRDRVPGEEAPEKAPERHRIPGEGAAPRQRVERLQEDAREDDQQDETPGKQPKRCHDARGPDADDEKGEERGTTGEDRDAIHSRVQTARHRWHLRRKRRDRRIVGARPWSRGQRRMR